ncbi:nucleotidyltransferase family protein [Bacillus sp. FSL R5-0654]|uniref:nucleotidyltransferase domain-containing protein n=1 Tax=Bacillus TaxID=1386 RepID=UPI0028803F23|nr:nucleotidyltransferase family protein [Bacillus sp. SG20001]WNF51267.1 nucleotidyltransferase family protein [Bacillus sp. SG20001]
MNNKDLRNEYKLIILLTKKDLNLYEKEHLVDLLHKNLEWDKIIGMLEVHRVAGIAWLNLKQYFFNDDSNRCAFPRLYKYLKNAYSIQKCRADEQFKYTSVICQSLTENKIEYVLLKGISLSEYVYEDLGLRDFNDNDILVHPDDTERAKSLILSLGYEQGESKHHSKIIKPNRKEILVRKLSSHEIVPLVKNVVDSEQFLTQHIIDLHFSVNLMTKNHNINIIDELFRRKIEFEINNQKIFMLNKESLLIFLAEHFYKEAICYRDVKMHKDLLLYKLADIYYLLAKKEIDWNWVLEFSKKYNFENQIFFALKYIQKIFDTTSFDRILNNLIVKEDTILNNVYHYDSDSLAFVYDNENLIERMFDIYKVNKELINPKS